MSSARFGKFLVLLLLFPTLILAMMVFSSRPRQPVDLCSTNAAAVGVDPASVPKGPIAGYSGEQLVNAAYIMQAAKSLGLSVRDQQIGVMTAMGESSLRVLDEGDAVGPDSRGLFQQRANGAWGSYADRMDPMTSATSYFKELAKISDRDSLEPTIVAHRVQHNADPYHYTKFWSSAVEVVQALAGTQAASTAPTKAGGVGGSSYDLGPVKPQTRALADLVGPKFALRDIGGVRPDSLPDHPSGLALDLMVYKDKVRGDAIAKYLEANARPLGVQYMIWYQHIWNIDRADEGWRSMADRGDPTSNHMDHVHVTMRTNVNVNVNGATMTVTDGASSDICTPSAGGSVAPSAGGWVKPTPGPITTPFGWRIHPINKNRSFHHGVDIGAPCDTPIRAAKDGVVVSADPSEPYGRWLIVDHGAGQLTRYGHMYDSGVLVHAGEKVKAGQTIARVGSAGWSTGCHLHLEISTGGEDVDPAPFFQKAGAALG